MLMIEPGADALQVTRNDLHSERRQDHFLDPAKGSVQFFVPKASEGKREATVNAPGGMPIQRPAGEDQRRPAYSKSVIR